MWANLVLQNGDYQYTPFSSMDRLSPRHETVYGVAVNRPVNGEEQYVTQVKCSIANKHNLRYNSTMAYSEDFKQLVLKKLRQGWTIRRAAKEFGI
ncbi:hypothetical protein, partial [Neisseria yangbaofengii]|uniref:hypothetical protein n=1 Tax=Neisseria yangbaofengii TaxID=2709396 RepID=UPI00197CEB8B